VIPFLSIVTGSGVHILITDLAPVIRRLCENHWKDAGGSQERLNLRLEPLFLGLDRIRLLSEAVRALLVGGLSPNVGRSTSTYGR
jgi:hypothetical protein